MNTMKNVLCDIRSVAQYDDQPVIVNHQQILEQSRLSRNRNYRELIIFIQTINQLEYMNEILNLSIDGKQ